MKPFMLGVGLLVVAAGLSRNPVEASPPRSVTFIGAAEDCQVVGKVLFAGHVHVSAFQVSKARALKAHLDSMALIRLDVPDEHAAFVHMDSMYVKLESMLAGTKALARGTSAVNGTFTLTFPPVDSVLVVGYQPQEDQDFYYSSKVMTGQASRSFVLDMSRGGCGFPPS